VKTCIVCGSQTLKKSGSIEKIVMTWRGKRTIQLQAYRCVHGHYVHRKSESPFDDSFIEVVVFTYLQSLSLNTTIELIRGIYREDILTKRQILLMIETVADALPGIDDIDRLFNPVRSGYLAFDGVWFQYGREQIVLLVCFDPETFDIVSASWEEDETQNGYENLIIDATNKIGAVNVKGCYGDGDNGLILALKTLLPSIPFQLCVFHKELRMGQVVPIKSIRRSKQMTHQTKHDIKVFQLLFREVIYAKTKKESYEAFDRLKAYSKRTNHTQPERFQKAYRSLAYNFKYTLTHFDHPGMRRDNNLLECFNGCIKPRLRLMRGFKKKENLDRYLKLFLLAYRFHPLKESRFKERRGSSPLEIAHVYLPPYYNFLTFLRTQLKLSYQLKEDVI